MHIAHVTKSLRVRKPQFITALVCDITSRIGATRTMACRNGYGPPTANHENHVPLDTPPLGTQQSGNQKREGRIMKHKKREVGPDHDNHAQPDN